jgi:hypothetical protein
VRLTVTAAGVRGQRYDRRVRHIRLLALAAALAAAGVLALADFGDAASTSIVGTWSGHVSRQRFVVVVNRGERAGTWRLGSRCAGTLRLKDISGGYHHYYRLAGATTGCAPLGVDCLKRAGAQMVDVFVPNAGGADTNVMFRRIG